MGLWNGGKEPEDRGPASENSMNINMGGKHLGTSGFGVGGAGGSGGSGGTQGGLGGAGIPTVEYFKSSMDLIVEIVPMRLIRSMIAAHTAQFGKPPTTLSLPKPDLKVEGVKIHFHDCPYYWTSDNENCLHHTDWEKKK